MVRKEHQLSADLDRRQCIFSFNILLGRISHIAPPFPDARKAGKYRGGAGNSYFDWLIRHYFFMWLIFLNYELVFSVDLSVRGLRGLDQVFLPPKRFCTFPASYSGAFATRDFSY